jgi:anti-sigma regulatory factor (Ser/Thr protein kinase)
MAKHRPQEIRHDLLARLLDPGPSPVTTVAKRYGITRQGVQRHFKSLIDEGLIVPAGVAPHRTYQLATLATVQFALPLLPAPEEDRVWQSSLRERLQPLDEKAGDILYYGFTEILNNAIDHSGGKRVRIWAERTAVGARIEVEDDGIGIFRKVSDAMRLADTKEAPLELAKGKFTTDPKRHTGEGIFFTSRAFTRIVIESNDIGFIYEHREPKPLWIVNWPDGESADEPKRGDAGTRVKLLLALPPPRPLHDVFSAFSSGPDDYRFARTHVPLKLAAVGDDSLVSRSSAKRVLARVDRFDEAVLDFAGVRTIGQAFADEIFRVFQEANPQVRLKPINASREVSAMIRRARASGRR